MAQIWVNNAISTLAAGINDTDTAIFVQPSHGSRFPVVAGSDYCFVTLEDAAGNVEILRVTAHGAGSATMTVTRGEQGTTARAYSIGDLVEMRLTALECNAWETLFTIKANRSGDTYTGVHDFSAATGVALPAATSIGPVSAAELGALDGVAGNIQNQLDNKASANGQVWSGVHVFPATVSIGDVSGLELSYLDGLISNVQGQINARAPLAGASYTGTHDFGLATLLAPTQPAATNDSTVATTAFVQAAAFASYANLPGAPSDDVPRALTTQGGATAWNSLTGLDQAHYLAGLV